MFEYDGRRFDYTSWFSSTGKEVVNFDVVFLNDTGTPQKRVEVSFNWDDILGRGEDLTRLIGQRAPSQWLEDEEKENKRKQVRAILDANYRA